MESPFLRVPPEQWIGSNSLAFAIRDAFPVNKGHSLVVTRRVVPSWWEATAEERVALWDLVDVVKLRIDAEFRPDGYNLGVNAGEAAGQTIEHLHVHVIPRYDGDVPDPRGGIRWVIPSKANYLAPSPSAVDVGIDLLPGGDDGMLRAVSARLADRRFDRIDLVVSFIMRSGLDLVADALEDALARGARIRVLTTDYLNITDAQALLRLLDLCELTPDRIAVRVFHDDAVSFHPKGYVFWSSAGDAASAVIGSSNLSRSALTGGIEWNVTTAATEQARRAFDALWDGPRSRPLTREWLKLYRETRPTTEDFVQFAQVRETPASVAPHEIQEEALAALAATREGGYRAGLVVMATGLGKTYLSAFDSKPYERVLFVAHREEILRQSRDSFRRVRPDADLGLYYGKEKAPDAEVLFAGIQTLADHLDEFAPDAFEYVVVDEFHHAAARSYRRVLDHFRPAFLLGLTATPERMDGADLLALCGENLVYRCDLVGGIERGELCPFEYFGVRDVVDFAPIPWRNGKFDVQALTRAVETRERADQALREWRERAGRRTLAFCCTVTHADFMAAHFSAAGVRAVAVHTGASSAPRHESVAALQQGRIEVLFSIDMFNEGLDVPEIDSVLMLRPTESPIVFLQQLGRGLRRGVPGKVLRVVDFIGNHRSFLLKPRTLLTLGAHGTSVAPAQVLEAMKKGEFDLPEGCKVAYDLTLVDMFRQLLRISTEDHLGAWCREVFDETGYRPSAAQAFRAGYNPASPRAKWGGWFDYLRHQELTTPQESTSIDAAGDFLRALEFEAITKSYKLVVLRALLHEGALLTGTSVANLATVSHDIVRGDPRLVRDVQTAELHDAASASDAAWEAYWRKWPVAAWLGELKGEKGRWFELDGDRFVPRFVVPSDLADTFCAMTAELIEWRLARYLVGKEPIATGVVRCRVSHASGNPIVFLPTKERDTLPRGAAVPFRADSVEYLGDFVKVALNVARKPGEPGNALATLLRRWFGPSAGHPGTDHRVLFEKTSDGWVLRPEVREMPTASGRGVVLPLFPDYAVACGAFGAPTPGERAPLHREIRPAAPGLADDPDLFLVTARGDSMDGGANPIRHGDPLLMRWIRSESLADLVGQVVLVEKGVGAARAPALKRLTRDGGGFALVSDHAGDAAIAADGTVRVVGRLIRRLDQREFNPLAKHLHQQFRREEIAPLYGQEFNPGNWNSGHVTLHGRIVLLTTLDKTAMSAGTQYEDRLVAPDVLEWTSQEKTKRTDKKGRGLLESLNEGVEVHLWLRRSKREGAFTYCGLVVPVGDGGDAPIRVTWRLLTPLPEDAIPSARRPS